MVITPYSSLRGGATVTPADPNTTGSFDISINVGGKGPTHYPTADRVLSGLFWPVNPGTPAVPVDNLLAICLSGAGTSAIDPHQNWYCYGGWNESTLDPDGVTVVAAPKTTVTLAMYNGTPYQLQWGLFANKLTDHDAFVALNPGAWLTPGSSMILEGIRTPVYYTDLFDVTQGVHSNAAYLHVRSTTRPSYYLSNNTKYYHAGYLQIVLTQSPIAGVP